MIATLLGSISISGPSRLISDRQPNGAACRSPVGFSCESRRAWDQTKSDGKIFATMHAQSYSTSRDTLLSKSNRQEDGKATLIAISRGCSDGIKAKSNVELTYLDIRNKNAGAR